jgi:hypothetical protein
VRIAGGDREHLRGDVLGQPIATLQSADMVKVITVRTTALDPAATAGAAL